MTEPGPRARLLLATTNAGKIREIRQILSGVPVELIALADLSPVEPPEETGSSFAENARLKALAYAGATGLPALAEDSGLEIDALDGAPGIHSARLGGDISYPAKYELIYRDLRARGASVSRARFVCATALAIGGVIVVETRGTVEGLIAAEPKGAGGFGYDPIFFYPPFDRTLAELSADQKAEVSHRGQAFRQLREWLQQDVKLGGS
ncbi:MAG TPA: RdgB/HAM1 family non-canonical purine NTP pyrophosphatase [Vicinamibacterales bacterium]